MKKVVTLEIWVDETLSDAEECVNEVYNDMMAHYFISDGSVDIKVIDVDKTIMTESEEIKL
jgi:hypothetical protein